MIPFKTTPYFCEKDWGGTKLRALYGKDTKGDATGESWEISALAEGECAAWGMPLSEAVTTFGTELMGDVQRPFPLLIKLLDARENLSVQVHPDDELALALEGQPYGKTEAWVVLDAPESAELIIGVRRSIGEVRRAMAEGRIEETLRRVPVKRGDTVFIPAGTVHALTAGIVVYEVQQSSDTTYRLYAWGRDAQLHLEKAIQAIKPSAEGAGIVEPKQIAPGVERLVACDAFLLDRLTAREGLTIPSDSSRFACYTALSSGRMEFEGGQIEYAAGDSMLAPASAGGLTLRGGELLRAVPVLAKNRL